MFLNFFVHMNIFDMETDNFNLKISALDRFAIFRFTKIMGQLASKIFNVVIQSVGRKKFSISLYLCVYYGSSVEQNTNMWSTTHS